MLPKIPIVRLSNSVGLPLPSYTDSIGTSMLLFAANSEVIKISPNTFAAIPTGFACALPLGMEAQVRSLKDSGKSGVIVLNAPLTFDASDRQEIIVTLFNASGQAAMIKRGQPIALLVFAPVVRVLWENKTPNEKSPEYTFVSEEPSSADEETVEKENLVPLDYQETVPYFKEEKEEEKLYNEEEVLKFQNEVDENLKASDEEIEMTVPSSHDEAAFLQRENNDMPEEKSNEVQQEIPAEEEQTPSSNNEIQTEEPSDDEFPSLPEIPTEQSSLQEEEATIEEEKKEENVEEPGIPSIPNIPPIEEDK